MSDIPSLYPCNVEGSWKNHIQALKLNSLSATSGFPCPSSPSMSALARCMHGKDGCREELLILSLKFIFFGGCQCNLSSTDLVAFWKPVVASAYVPYMVVQTTLCMIFPILSSWFSNIKKHGFPGMSHTCPMSSAFCLPQRFIFLCWLVVYHGIPTPLKNDGVRQLGWFELPNCFWKVIIQSCSKPPTNKYNDYIVVNPYITI